MNKTLEKTYVIIKLYEDQYSYFEGKTSFNKKELETVCKALNEPNKKTCLSMYKVVTLAEAIESFRDIVADAYIEQDESY